MSMYARVFENNPDNRTPAPGYRGYVVLENGWVHISDPEFLLKRQNPKPTDPLGKWVSLEIPCVSIPSRLVQSIEWTEETS